MTNDATEFKPDGLELTGSFVDDMHNIAICLRSVSDQLSRLAGAFYRTGNDKVGGELGKIHKELDHYAKLVSSICGTKVTADLEQSQKATGQILTMALHAALQKPTNRESKT